MVIPAIVHYSKIAQLTEKTSRKLIIFMRILQSMVKHMQAI
jgi:hypothetical protein